MLDFRLKVFHTVARRLNFTKAAEELFISQPAVSKHIQEIEHQYRCQLFERNGTRITLTDAGQLLFRYAEKILKLYRHLEFDMHALQEQISEALRLGASKYSFFKMPYKSVFCFAGQMSDSKP